MTRRHTVHTLSSILLFSEIRKDGRGEEEAGGRRGESKQRRGGTRGSEGEGREEEEVCYGGEGEEREKGE